MQDARRHPYLENERGIPGELLEIERFAGRVRIDARGNAVFPHFDRRGLCGYEIKNSDFTGFAAGGSKGLWSSRHAALFTDDRARYASIGGKPNPEQPELIRMAIAGMPAKSKIVAAKDADAESVKLAEVVRQAVQLSGRDDLCFIFQEPFGFTDWNDQLRAKPRPSLPFRPEEPSVA